MRFFAMKRTIVATCAALALGVAALGVVGAQQRQDDENPGRAQHEQREQRHQQYLEAVAKRLNVDADRLKRAMAEARQEVGWAKRGGRDGGHRGGQMMRGGLQAAAGALQMSVEDLWRELPGHSLVDLAKARNIDPDTVASAIRKAANERIDKATEGGRLSAEQARAMTQRLDQRIDRLMTRSWPARGQRPGPGGGSGR